MDHWLIYTHISEVYGHKIIAILADWSDKKHYWYHYVGSFPFTFNNALLPPSNVFGPTAHTSILP